MRAVRCSAIASYDQALRLHPKLSAVYIARVNAHYELGDYWGEVEDYTYQRRLYPNQAAIDD